MLREFGKMVRLLLISAVLLLPFWASAGDGSVRLRNLEKVMREIQGRREFLGGKQARYPWTCSPCGGSDAPFYPPDGYYDAWKDDPVRAKILVESLVNAVYAPGISGNGTNSLYMFFCTPPANPESFTGVTSYREGAGATIDVSNAYVPLLNSMTVTWANYPELFDTIEKYVAKMKYCLRPVTFAGISAGIGFGVGGGTVEDFNGCSADFLADIMSAMATDAWLETGAADESTIELGSDTSFNLVQGNFSTVSATVENWHSIGYGGGVCYGGTTYSGRFVADMGGNTGGFTIYLQPTLYDLASLVAGNSLDSLMTVERATAAGCPVPADGNWHRGEGAINFPMPMLIPGDFRTWWGGGGVGWKIGNMHCNSVYAAECSGAVAVATPIFRTTPDKCTGCGSCASSTHCESVDSCHFRIGFGRISEFAEGALLLDEENLSANSYSPEALTFNSAARGIGCTIYQRNGHYPIDVTNGGVKPFVDITVAHKWKYTISVYKRGDVDATTYPCQPLANRQPVSTFVIENPDFVMPASGNANDATPPCNALRLTANESGRINVQEFRKDPATGIWQLRTNPDAQAGREARTETVSVTLTGSRGTIGTTRTETRAVAGELGVGQLLAQETTVYTQFAWGEEKTAHTLGSGANRQTTAWEYYDVTSDNAAYGKLKLVVNADGTWEAYRYANEYGGGGVLSKTITKILTPAGNVGVDVVGDEKQCHVTEVQTLWNAATPVRTTIEYERGVELSRRVVTHNIGSYYWYNSYLYDYDTATTVETAAGDPANPRTTVRQTNYFYTPGGLCGDRVDWPGNVQHPDGTFTVNSYNRPTTTVASGIGTRDPSGTINITDGTRTVTRYDENNANTTLFSETTDIATNTVLSHTTYTNPDEFGRPQRVDYLDGTYETMKYGCCGLEEQTDRDGIKTSYIYDDFKRLTATTRLGITNITEYDAAGHAFRTSRAGTSGSPVVLSQSTYDDAGRLTSSTDAAGTTTTYAESADGRTKTTTYADGSTRSETSGTDGSPLSAAANGVITTKYGRGVAAGALQWAMEIRVAASGKETEWVKTYTNALGQNVKTEYPDGATELSFYNANGQLVKTIAADGEATLYAYNAKNELEFTCLDANGNGTMDFAGSDRITKQTAVYTSRNGKATRLTKSLVWDRQSMDFAHLVSVTEATLDGTESWSRTLPTNPDGSGGLETHSVTVSVRATDTTPARRTTTTTAPDGSYSISVAENGRTLSADSYAANGGRLGHAEYTYDAHGRIAAITTPQATTTCTYDAADRVVSQTVTATDGSAAPQTTSCTYDNMGRVSTSTAADGTVTHNEYYLTGQLKKTWGGQGNYPVEYTYDNQGRMTSMKTWRDFASAAGAAVTTWHYDTRRGFSVGKSYPDGKGPTYTYTKGGKLATRTWARSASPPTTPYSPLTTTYTYSPTTGDLLATDYSNTQDFVPDVSYTYDRLGRRTAVTSPVDSTSYSFSDTGQLTAETHTAGPLTDLTVTRAYDTLQRPAALTVSSPGNANLPIGASYAYDTASRLAAITSGSASFTYTYAQDRGNLVTGMTTKQGTNTVLTNTKTHDAFGRLLSTQTVSPGNANLQIGSAYTYNQANQRIKNTREDNAYWEYQYDAKGQVIAGTKKTAAGNPIPGMSFGYAYDDIGNRISATVHGNANLPIGASPTQVSNYTANPLNQYTQRSVPGVFNLRGFANPAATVSAITPAASVLAKDVTRAERAGDFWHTAIPVDTTTAAVSQDAKVVAVLKNQGPDGKDIVGEYPAGKFFVPKTPELFTYDADGNLLADGRFTYTWDTENRLVSAETSVGTGISPMKRLEFTYDAQGRRLTKTVFSWSGSAWTLEKSTAFLYDGWNLIAEFALSQSNGTVTQSLVRSHVWGLDLSGSMQGAGGGGGLLCTFSAGTPPAVTFPVYDGNGNEVSLVDATGSVAASYEYDPFGKTLLKSGASADANPFRFSTKYFDVEIGLYYYGHRYYSPEMGMWISRDPMTEQGGINLYSFCNNDAMNAIDLLGLAKATFTIRGTREKIVLNEPSSAEFAAKLISIGAAGKKIDRLDILGHGSSDAIFINSTHGEPRYLGYIGYVAGVGDHIVQVDKNKVMLYEYKWVKNHVIIAYKKDEKSGKMRPIYEIQWEFKPTNGIDITNSIKAITDKCSLIYLNGCLTAQSEKIISPTATSIAKEMSSVIADVTVRGNAGLAVGIGIGTIADTEDFRNGQHL